jgi:hypothetical protein
MQHPKDIGDRSTMALIFALSVEGYPILLPFGRTSATTSSSTRDPSYGGFNARPDV